MVGGSPAPSLTWSNSISDSKFDVTVDKIESLAGKDGGIKSMVTYTTEAKFHQQYFTCNVKQVILSSFSKSSLSQMINFLHKLLILILFLLISFALSLSRIRLSESNHSTNFNSENMF